MDIRAEVKKELNNAGLDVPVVSSRLPEGNSLPDTHDYAAELRGAKNYNASEPQFNKIIEEWISDTDWSVWNTLDIVQINQDDRNHPATTFLEAYRYKDDGPDWDLYGHEELHYEVRVHRFDENLMSARSICHASAAYSF